MTIGIASGKGGTGKTTISTNLAASIASAQSNVRYLDCDAEEPNGHIFLRPTINDTEDVKVAVPQIDAAKCTGCGKCADLCQYNAIACIKGKAMVFEELCHSCGGCIEICPTGAVSEKLRAVGTVELGRSGHIDCVCGKLNVGAIQTPAVIKRVKKNINPDAINILDAPPGTSCPVIETIKDADFVLLVTEPTPFGLNDLVLAVDMAAELKIPFAVAVNRSDIGNDAVVSYCRDNEIEIMMEIRNDRRIAESYSKGMMMIETIPEYRDKFLKLYDDIKRRVEI